MRQSRRHAAISLFAYTQRLRCVGAPRATRGTFPTFTTVLSVHVADPTPAVRRVTEDISAFGAARCRATLGIRLDGRMGNLPSSGLSPDQSQQLVRLHHKRNKQERASIAAP